MFDMYYIIHRVGCQVKFLVVIGLATKARGKQSQRGTEGLGFRLACSQTTGEQTRPCVMQENAQAKTRAEVEISMVSAN